MLDTKMMRADWEINKALMYEPEGDGSLFGRYFIISTLACKDIFTLLDELERKDDNASRD